MKATRAAAVIGLLWALWACSPDQQARESLPTWASHCPSGVPCSAGGAFLTGRLTVVGECLALQLDDGRVAAISWPRDYSATFGPAVVYDERGGPVLREGDHFSAAGNGPTRLERPDRCALTLGVAVTQVREPD